MRPSLSVLRPARQLDARRMVRRSHHRQRRDAPLTERDLLPGPRALPPAEPTPLRPDGRGNGHERAHELSVGEESHEGSVP